MTNSPMRKMLSFMSLAFKKAISAKTLNYVPIGIKPVDFSALDVNETRRKILSYCLKETIE